MISRLPIVNTRAFSFSVIIPPVVFSHVSPGSHANERTIYRTRFPFPFTMSFCATEIPSRHRRRHHEDDSAVSRDSHHPLSLVPHWRREVCDSPLPRVANYIVRNVNLVCQAVSAREGSLTSLDGTCTSLVITASRDEEISSYSWEHPTARSIRSIYQYAYKGTAPRKVPRNSWIDRANRESDTKLTLAIPIVGRF